jgi:single-strand DNA-binding protein
MAQVAFTGIVGQDVTTRFTGDGKAIASFSVAESVYVGKGKGKDGKDYGTEWWSVTVFGPQAQTMSNKLGKGSKVTIFGKTQSREYEKDGEWTTAKGLKVTADSVVPHEKGQSSPAPAAEEDVPDLSDLLETDD